MPGALPLALAAAAALGRLAAAPPESVAVVGLEATREQAEGSELALLQTHFAARTRRREVARSKDWPQPGDPEAEVTPQQEALMEMLKKAMPKGDVVSMSIVNSTLSALAVMPTRYLIQEGGYDILFQALRDYADDPTVQMNAFRGLSDQSWTESGSRLITHYDGPFRGIEYMVESLRAHPVGKTALCADHLTYQYEVLQCISGLLSHDVNGTAGGAAVKAGLLEGAVNAMRSEPDLRPTQDAACVALTMLLSHSGAAADGYGQRLRELGAPELLRSAIATYSVDDPTPFWFGTTYGEVYPVAPKCQLVLSAIKIMP